MFCSCWGRVRIKASLGCKCSISWENGWKKGEVLKGSISSLFVVHSAIGDCGRVAGLLVFLMEFR